MFVEQWVKRGLTVVYYCNYYTVMIPQERSTSSAQKPNNQDMLLQLQQLQRGSGGGVETGAGSGLLSNTVLTLDQLAVVGKNPVYFPSDFDQSFYAGLAVLRIPRDCLTLLEEIGQGAFGKVYKGYI